MLTIVAITTNLCRSRSLLEAPPFPAMAVTDAAIALASPTPPPTPIPQATPITPRPLFLVSIPKFRSLTVYLLPARVVIAKPPLPPSKEISTSHNSKVKSSETKLRESSSSKQGRPVSEHIKSLSLSTERKRQRSVDQSRER